MPNALLTVAICLLSTVATAAWAQSDNVDTAGAAAPRAPLSWGRLQGRVAFATNATPLRTDVQGSETAFKVSSLSLMGDYYLHPSLNQLTLGGLRATSGIVFGQRSALWGMPASGIGPLSVDRRSLGADPYNTGYNAYADHSTTPYLGIGYSGNGTAFGKSASWGFTADLGLMSLSPGAIGRIGKVFSGSQNLDDMVRDLRLSPVLQFGFSYAF
jgi:hypothetical protein